MEVQPSKVNIIPPPTNSDSENEDDNEQKSLLICRIIQLLPVLYTPEVPQAAEVLIIQLYLQGVHLLLLLCESILNVLWFHQTIFDGNKANCFFVYFVVYHIHAKWGEMYISWT